MAASANQIVIDDTQPLSCVIQTTETEGDHVVYLMKIQRGYDAKYTWMARRRYNEFFAMHTTLKQTNYELPMPPKKAFGNMNREFLSTRQLGLQEFMEKLLANLMLANSAPVKKFLDEENYLQNFRELALAHVSMFFRSEPNWQIVEPLNEIGWRLRKQHILLKNVDASNSKYILTWCEHGPDKLLKEAELKTIFQQFTQIQHDNIEPIIRINSGDTSTVFIQRYHEKLISLRDLICGVSKINNSYMKKYALLKSYQTLSTDQIKVIGKQILLALQFIYSKGLFYGQLHTGNVLIETWENVTKIRLTDLPNSLLGLPYYYRPYIIEQRKVNNLELVDVYGFGHCLYEMVYGAPLVTDSSVRDFTDCPNREVKGILESILLEDVLRNGIPTINQLLEMPFFKDVNLGALPTSSSSAAAVALNTNNKLFSSTKVKDYLMRAREHIEKRLNEEQKALYKIKRRSQAEAKVLSEDEIRKRRREQKKAERESASFNTLEFPTLLFENHHLFNAASPTRVTSSSKQNNGSLNSSVRSSDMSSETSSIPGSPPPTPVSAKPPPPPPPPPPAPGPPPPPPGKSGGPPPPPPPPATSLPKADPDRSQLLSSISGFSKNGLKKTKTNDRSAPKV